MDLNQFTIKSQEVITKAQQLCLAYNQQSIENSHLLLALLESDQNVIPHILQKCNVDMAILKVNLTKQIQSLPQVTGAQIQWSSASSKTLLNALNRK
jgi:ATP-dependent Clp protease ATP-binding subunit ClpB